MTVVDRAFETQVYWMEITDAATEGEGKRNHPTCARHKSDHQGGLAINFRSTCKVAGLSESVSVGTRWEAANPPPSSRPAEERARPYFPNGSHALCAFLVAILTRMLNGGWVSPAMLSFFSTGKRSTQSSATSTPRHAPPGINPPLSLEVQ